MRWRLFAVRLLGAALVGAMVNLPAAADPKSDLLQPDAFHTGRALQKRTVDLEDPLGRECPLPAGALSLSAAVDVALCRNPATRSSWAAARAQAAALGGAESALLPSLSATGSESRTYGTHVDVNGNSVSTPQDTRDAALNLSWTLYDFGGISANIKSARFGLDAAADTVNSTSQQTVLNVVQSYYGVVAADAAVVAAKSAEAAYARSVEIAEALQKGGAASLSDVLQAQTAYDQAVLTRVQYEYAAASAHGTLSVAIGSPANVALKLGAQPVPASVPAFTARIADLMAQAQAAAPGSRCGVCAARRGGGRTSRSRAPLADPRSRFRPAEAAAIPRMQQTRTTAKWAFMSRYRSLPDSRWPMEFARRRPLSRAAR